MNISIEIEPRAWTRKLGGMVDKVSQRSTVLREKWNAKRLLKRVRRNKK